MNYLFLEFFHLIYSHHSCLQVTETAESETMDKKEPKYFFKKKFILFWMIMH
jgi:hypothetical protein